MAHGFRRFHDVPMSNHFLPADDAASKAERGESVHFTEMRIIAPPNNGAHFVQPLAETRCPPEVATAEPHEAEVTAR